MTERAVHGVEMAGGKRCAIAVRRVDSRDEYLGAGDANTICGTALDMMRALAAAVN